MKSAFNSTTQLQNYWPPLLNFVDEMNSENKNAGEKKAVKL